MSITDRKPSPDSRLSVYAELASEVRGLGLLGRRPGFYAGMLTANMLALTLVVAAIMLLRNSWWLLLLAPVFAVVSTQIAFFGHDVGHRQVARRALPRRVLGLLHGNLLNGLSYGWWVDKHNAHHAHPNDLDADPDVHSVILAFDGEQAATRHGAAAWVTRHQAWLFFPLLVFEALNLHLSSVRALFGSGSGSALRYRGTEIVLLAIHFVAYGVLLVTTMNWLQASVFVAVHQGLLGLYLGCSFAPNHKGMPALSAQQSADPLLRQVLTSRNIRGGLVVDVVLGGLNYQIEHHLFPSMARPNLRRAQPVVRRFCEQHGVTYQEASVLASYGEVLRHLRDVGAALQ